MFRHNPKVKYKPNGGAYLQILSRKDLYNQTIVASSNYIFPVRLGEMRVGDKVWMNWNKAPLKLWQTQLNFAVFCASSASKHLNYKRHPMVRSLY